MIFSHVSGTRRPRKNRVASSISLAAVIAMLLSFVGVITATSASASTTPVVTWASPPASSATPNANRYSIGGSITPDGKYTVFKSMNTDFGPSSTNGGLNAYRRNNFTGETILVSVNTDGSQLPNDLNGNDVVISANGEWVAWTQYIPGYVDSLPMARNIVTGQTYSMTNAVKMFAFAISNNGTVIVGTPNPDFINSSWVKQAALFNWQPVAGTLSQIIVYDNGSTTPVGLYWWDSVSLSADGQTLVARTITAQSNGSVAEGIGVIDLSNNTLARPFPNTGDNTFPMGTVSPNGRYVYSWSYYNSSPQAIPTGYANRSLIWDKVTNTLRDVTPGNPGPADPNPVSQSTPGQILSLPAVNGSMSDDGNTVIVAAGHFGLDPENIRPIGGTHTYSYDTSNNTFHWIYDGSPKSAAANIGAVSYHAINSSLPAVHPGHDYDVYISSLNPLVSPDVTAPSVTVTGVTADNVYPAGTSVTPGCSTTDTESGVKTNAVVTVIHTGTSYTATCSGAVDNAGNTANPVSVNYTIKNPDGFTSVSVTDSIGHSLVDVPITVRSGSGAVVNIATGTDGTASTVLPPGTYTVTAKYATGLQSKQLTVTADGPNSVAFKTVAATVKIADPVQSDIDVAKVQHAGNTGAFESKTAVNSAGEVTFEVLPGTNTFTAWVAGGYQTKTVTVAADTPSTVNFTTSEVTVNVNDPESTDIAAAKVQHAGNTGAFGAKTSVDSSGKVTFQALPGTSTFTAWVAGGYQSKSLVVTADGPNLVSYDTVPVAVTVVDSQGSPRLNATVQHAGNTGAFGPKVAVDSTGTVVAQSLPGTSTFTAWAGSKYKTATLAVTAGTSTTITIA